VQRVNCITSRHRVVETQDLASNNTATLSFLRRARYVV